MDVRLKPITQSDVDALYVMHSDTDAAWQAGVGLSGRTRADFAALMLKKSTGTEDMFVCAIWADGQIVGDMGSFMRGDKREVSYWLGRAHWGKGIATTALRHFLPLLIDVYPKSPLYARVVDGNKASAVVLQKCGFKPVEHDHFFSEVRGAEVNETIFQCKPL